MNVKDIEIGNWYHISGDIDNGTKDGRPYTSTMKLHGESSG